MVKRGGYGIGCDLVLQFTSKSILLTSNLLVFSLKENFSLRLFMVTLWLHVASSKKKIALEWNSMNSQGRRERYKEHYGKQQIDLTLIIVQLIKEWCARSVWLVNLACEPSLCLTVRIVSSPLLLVIQDFKRYICVTTECMILYHSHEMIHRRVSRQYHPIERRSTIGANLYIKRNRINEPKYEIFSSTF